MLDLWPPDLAESILSLPLDAGTVAAFDADETLWHTDAGIGFLEHACNQRLLADPTRGPEVFTEYLATRAQDVGEGLMACATAFVGLPVRRVEALALDYTATHVLPLVYPAMRQLVHYLHDRGVRVFVVTASFEHAVRAGAAALGVPAERVIGIRLAESGGVLTDERIGPITYRDGKASELLARAGVAPLLAMGNGSNDIELLDAATSLAVAVNPATSPRSDGAASLAAHAAHRGWPVLTLTDPSR